MTEQTAPTPSTEIKNSIEESAVDTAPTAEATAEKSPTEKAERPTNVPFNLVIASSSTEVETLVSQFGLSDVYYLSDVERQARLPTSGPARGAALDRFLGERVEKGSIPTLAIVQAESWVNTLLDAKSSLSRSVWRSIESSLMGHRTNQQRNMVVVGLGFMFMSRMEAEARGHLIVVTKGQSLPPHWRPERVKVEKPVQDAKSKKTPENHPKRRKEDRVNKSNDSKGVEKRTETKRPADSGTKGAQDARKKRGARAGNGSPILNDLYLLCKGHYGPVGDSLQLMSWTKETMRFHTGAQDVSDEDAIKQLFHTLVAHSTRAHWGGFNLLQELVTSAARGTRDTAQTLAGWIGTIPVRDAEGKEIAQPQVNADLTKRLESYSRSLIELYAQ